MQYLCKWLNISEFSVLDVKLCRFFSSLSNISLRSKMFFLKFSSIFFLYCFFVSFGFFIRFFLDFLVSLPFFPLFFTGCFFSALLYCRWLLTRFRNLMSYFLKGCSNFHMDCFLFHHHFHSLQYLVRLYLVDSKRKFLK